MLITDLFITGLKNGAANQRHWVYSLFSVTEDTTPTSHYYPYQIVREPAVVRYYDPETEQLEVIDDGVPDEPLLAFRQRLVLYPGTFPNAPKDGVTTTYGTALLNYQLLVEVFGDKIPYQGDGDGYFDVGAVEKLIERRLVDDPAPGEEPPKDAITVSENVAFCERALNIVAYSSISVQSTTPKALMGHPKAQQLRDELMQKYQGQLTDPAVIAKIGDALEALDREWLENDPSMDFYLSGKYFSKVRKKLFYMFGAESSFSDGTQVTFIPQSLQEGIDVNALPDMINSLREGTYSRGRMTQLGGESTKTIYRMLGTVRVAEDDCGTPLRNPTFIPPNHTGYVGFWVQDTKEGDVLLTETNITQYQNRTVQMRDPFFCKTEKGNVCARCMGEANAELEYGIPATAAQVGGRFLTIFLKAMHGRELKTARYDYQRRIR